MADLAAVNTYIDHNLDRFLAEVSAICRIPSVGSDEAAMAEARRWLEVRFTHLGLATRSIEWDGAHPYVLATATDGPRSVLFFNHYDVADYTNPVRETPGERHPFSGAIENGKLYARGSADDKGTLLARMHAVEALRSAGPLPLRVTFLWEGQRARSDR